MHYETPFKGPSGVYHVKLYNPKNQKRTTRSTRARTQREAMEVIRRWEEEQKSPWSFERAWHLWLEHQKPRVSDHAYRLSESLGRNHILPAFGDTLLGEITALDVEAHLTKRYEVASRSTVNKELTTLKQFLRWCVSHTLVEKNVAASQKPLAVPEKEPRVLTEEEDLRMAYGLRERFWGSWEPLWYEVAIGSGLRRQTIQLLTRAHVDLKEGLWKIPAAAMKGRRRLDAPMTPRAQKAVEERLEQLDKGDWSLFPDATEPVIRHALGWVSRAVGVNHFGSHVLRKTFITRIIRGGADLKMAQKLTGIRDLKILQRHYYEVRVRDMRPVVEGVEALRITHGDEAVIKELIGDARARGTRQRRRWQAKKARPYPEVVQAGLEDNPTDFLARRREGAESGGGVDAGGGSDVFPGVEKEVS